MGKKVILVGDHKQLPHMLSPEVVKEYRKEGNTEQMQVLEESLFERLFNTLEASGAKKRTTRLTKQYRMNPIISNFASKCFYEEKNTDVGLDSSEVKVEEKQANLGMYKDKPLVFLDLPQETFDAEKSGVSKSRPAEAKVIMDEVVKVLKKAGYIVDGCFDGEEALLHLLGAEYDAILLDIMMPKLDGLSMLIEYENGKWWHYNEKGEWW